MGRFPGGMNHQQFDMSNYNGDLGRTNPYSLTDSNPYSNPAGANSYEMEAVGENPYESRADISEASTKEVSVYGTNNDVADFFDEVDEIKKIVRRYDQNIDTIESLHKQALSEISGEQETYTREQIGSLANETSALSQSLKDRIKSLQSRSTRDSTKKTQAENLKRQFMNAIQRYQTVEATFRQKYREQAERQFRIVRPEATDAEVKAAIEDVQGEQIFSQALRTSNRRGEAQTALSEVQTRHREIQKIEQTMAELAQLFHDMELLVAEQEAPVQHVEKHTEQVQVDVEQGMGHTSKAVVFARAARKKKWWCLLICLIIIILAVCIPVGIWASNNNKKD
ncbi:t-SNARE [Yarrowia lipolytica]|nr:t-SNARE [Yarrowia lipolytica]KAE8172106.1 t-SNARE [Yarrowia lipolytica]RDW23147.1 t-SNARE [Yarrowia lipolytica]RDW31088.1 t-SNARE [Yarrowia lipolytica]RDW36620.1 t-SNARE [Yarrowia lipolytica]